MYLNGFTRESTMAAIKAYNDNTRAYDNDREECMYETNEGNRCAVGCFIPDDHDGLMYHGGARALLSNYPDLETFMPMSVERLVSLQNTHDSCHVDDLYGVLEEKLKSMEESYDEI